MVLVCVYYRLYVRAEVYPEDGKMGDVGDVLEEGQAISVDQALVADQGHIQLGGGGLYWGPSNRCKHGWPLDIAG